MSILTLNNGVEISVLETSTPNSIQVQGDLGTIDIAIKNIASDTMKNADLAGVTIINKVYTGFNGSREGDIYTVTFALRDKTEMELLFGKVQDVEDGLAEVADIVAGM